MSSSNQRWFIIILHSLPITLLVSGLFYYWFAIIDRFIIFLYGHLGATAFDAVTISRYWMSGLVAGGIVMIFYSAVIIAISLINATYTLPAWWQVWLLSAVPLIVIMPSILMNLNQPVLPGNIAAWVTAVTLIALALALLPAGMIIDSPVRFAWLMAAGLGLVPCLLLLHIIELPKQGLVRPTVAYVVGIGSTVAGAIWSITIGRLYVKRRHATWTFLQLLTTGLQISYLILPLIHYLLMTPPQYRYISNARNFFALTPFLQLSTWGFAMLISLSVVAFQKRVIPLENQPLPNN